MKNSGCEIVASENGFIVWRCVADECEIITICVAPDARGTGIADAMLQLMEREILKTRVQPHPTTAGELETRPDVKIFLEVSADNIPARKLYEKHGYKQIGIRPKYYPPNGATGDGIDAIVMGKSIPA